MKEYTGKGSAIFLLVLFLIGLSLIFLVDWNSSEMDFKTWLCFYFYLVMEFLLTPALILFYWNQKIVIDESKIMSIGIFARKTIYFNSITKIILVDNDNVRIYDKDGRIIYILPYFMNNPREVFNWLQSHLPCLEEIDNPHKFIFKDRYIFVNRNLTV